MSNKTKYFTFDRGDYTYIVANNGKAIRRTAGKRGRPSYEPAKVSLPEGAIEITDLSSQALRALNA